GRVGTWLSALMTGSLLKRTLVSVGAFVVGSAAFVTITSLVLVSVARGVLPSHSGSGSASSSTQQSDSDSTKSSSKTIKPKKGRTGASGDDAPTKPGSDDSKQDE